MFDGWWSKRSFPVAGQGQLIHTKPSSGMFRFLLAKQHLFNDLDFTRHGLILFATLGDSLHGVHHGGVVSTAEIRHDFFKAVAGVSPGHPHAKLSRHGDGFVPAAGKQVGQFEVVVVADCIHDVLNTWG